jgi:hypothetical protein
MTFAGLAGWLPHPALAQIEPGGSATAAATGVSSPIPGAHNGPSSVSPSGFPGDISFPVTAAVELRASPGRDEIVAQIGALGSVVEARSLLVASPEVRAGALQGRIQPAIEGERVYYRALVAGFSNRSQAAGFCADVIRAGGACFVR